MNCVYIVSMSVRPKKPRKAATGRRKRAGKSRRRSYSRRRRTEPGSIITKGSRIFMMLPGKLRSPNKLKSGLARHGDTKAWEARVQNARVVQTDSSVLLPVLGRAKLSVTRLVPTKACYLDRTNLAFCIKGLEDALVRLGYLYDDNVKWLDGPYVEQDLSPDREYWASVVIDVL